MGVTGTCEMQTFRINGVNGKDLFLLISGYEFVTRNHLGRKKALGPTATGKRTGRDSRDLG